jgi:hypothetical protein
MHIRANAGRDRLCRGPLWLQTGTKSLDFVVMKIAKEYLFAGKRVVPPTEFESVLPA